MSVEKFQKSIELAERFIKASIKHSAPTSIVRYFSEPQIHAAAIYCAAFKEDSERPDFLEMIEHKEATETEFARK